MLSVTLYHCTAHHTQVAPHSADIDRGSERVKSFIQMLREHKTVVDPTLGVFEGSFTARPGIMAPAVAPVAARLPAQIRRGFLSGGLPVAEDTDQRYKDSFRQMLRMTKALYDAGIPIVAGTDGFAGFALHREVG